RFTRTESDDPDTTTRARRANDLEADLFLSLHLNSHTEPTAEGASTYHFGGSRAGEALAECVQNRLAQIGQRDCRSHARSYAILKETRMPAVLVEPAFISNPDEAKRLEDPAFQRAVAIAIANGVIDYFGDQLPGS
ncbi:MAG: N-acetylmuramoyl-L-alanine amidase family protein, partial [Actinomycetota bacterium]